MQSLIFLHQLRNGRHPSLVSVCSGCTPHQPPVDDYSPIMSRQDEVKIMSSNVLLLA